MVAQLEGGAVPSASGGRDVAHIIVVGNEKGGSGKSTTSMHLATALARLGHRICTLDLDLRQKSLGRYIENRRHFVEKNGLSLAIPSYTELPEIARDELAPGENVYDRRLSDAVASMEGTYDFILIDCPGSHTTAEPGRAFAGRHAGLAAQRQFRGFRPARAFRPRQQPHPRPLDLFGDGLERPAAAGAGGADAHRLGRGAQPRGHAGHAQQGEDGERAHRHSARRIGFRVVQGFSERVIFRELFPRGLTLLDLRDIGVKGQMNISNVAARQELRDLMKALRLPGVTVDF
jgi:chromosome partitioning protein